MNTGSIGEAFFRLGNLLEVTRHVYWRFKHFGLLDGEGVGRFSVFSHDKNCAGPAYVGFEQITAEGKKIWLVLRVRPSMSSRATGEITEATLASIEHFMERILRLRRGIPFRETPLRGLRRDRHFTYSSSLWGSFMGMMDSYKTLMSLTETLGADLVPRVPRPLQPEQALLTIAAASGYAIFAPDAEDGLLERLEAATRAKKD